MLDMAISPGGRPADASPIGTPGGRQNWVDQTGGLPRYIRMIAHALIRQGMTPSHAIATAVNRVRKLAATSGNPKVKAAAAAAVAEWESKKARAHATTNLSTVLEGVPDLTWHLDLSAAADELAPGEVLIDLTVLEDDDAALLLDLAPGDYRPPYDWKHGYIPITPAAALSKAKGDRKRAAKLLGGRVRGGKIPVKRGRVAGEKRKRGTFESGPNSRSSSNPSPRVAKAMDDEARGRGVPGELAAAKKAAAPKSPGPSDAEKVANAARMFGTGSPQHKAAQARFGGGGGSSPVAAVGSTRTVPASDVHQGDVWHAPGLGGKVKRYRIDKAHPPLSDGSRNVDVTDLDTGGSKQLTMQGAGKEHRIERKSGGSSPKGDAGGSPDARATLEAARADRARLQAGGERRKAETPVTPDRVRDLNENLDWNRDGSVSTSGRGGRLDYAVQHGLVEFKPVGRSAQHDDRYVVTEKGRKAGLRPKGDAGGEPAKPDVSSGDGTVSPQTPGSDTGAGNRPSGARASRFAPKEAAPLNDRQRTFNAAKDAEKRGDFAAAEAEYKKLGNRENDVARVRSKAIKAGGTVEPWSPTPTPTLTQTTARRMTDDQLEKALGRLFEAGGTDTAALKVLEDELDRRDKGTTPTAPKVASLTSYADQLDAATKHFTPRAQRWVPALARALREGRTEDAETIVGNIDSAEAHEARGSHTPTRAALANVMRLLAQHKQKAGGSPKGDAAPAADPKLEDLTHKADRESHRFTPDTVSRMTQPQLERSLGTLLSAGFDNDSPAVSNLLDALEKRDKRSARSFRKGGDRVDADRKVLQRSAHGTRAQQQADYHGWVEQQAKTVEASDAVGAHALAQGSRGTGVRVRDIWSMSPASIRKHASLELLEWFSIPGNEPLPFDAWRAAHLGATDRRAVESLRRRREQWLSEFG